MKLLLDIHFPVRLAAHLRSKGHDVVRADDIGLGEAEDREIWLLAQSQERIVISKDEDFVFLSMRPGDGGRLLWVRLENCRNAVLIRAIDESHEQILNAFESGEKVVELW
jgi:predicted nuclease of predicted toxin-antitoxin system